ncbi:MAG: S-layer homology domain-containing protein, partial [Clostridia bacterium]|nr:S-layer homology domain-containing protein [Clostridia bacterium]
MKRIGKLGIVVLASICVCMLVSAAVSAAALTDIEKHWAKEYIEYGVEKGYISGYEDGTFLPDKTVTRAEFSKMINSAVKLTAVGSAKGDFTDVKSSDWYFNEVKKAENAGYITGYEDGSFRPSNSVTRQEAAVILSRIVLPISQRADINSFGDGDKIDTWATDAVTMIAAKGYIKGDEKKNFNPKGALTRSQAAKLICEFVKNENVVNRNQNITDAGKEIVYTESLFTDDIVIDVEGAQELTVVFKNCRVLGTVYVKTEDAVLKFENTKVKALSVDEDDAEIEPDKTSEVKNASIFRPATLTGDDFKKVVLSGEELSAGTVKLEGTFADVTVEADAFVAAETVKAMAVTKKVSLSIQSGTVEKLTVESGAKGATINLASKVVVEKAENKAAVSYVGGGKIELAVNEVTGVSFDGVTVEKQEGKKGDGDSVGSKTDDKFFEDVTVTPAKGKTNQAISVNVQLTFIKNVLDKKGEKLTADYIEDNFELRKSTASGTKIAYEATVASTGKKITINPVANLTNGSTYYLVIPKGVLTYDDGSENDKFETYFKTAAANDDEKDDEDENAGDDEDEETTVTMSPKNGAEDVSIGTTIKLTFDGTVKAYSTSDTFDEEYVEDNFVIYEGSTSGDTISFTASVSGKTVSLTPSILLGDTKYYVVIPSKTVKVGSDALSKTTMSFTTEAGVPIKITPESGATGVSTIPEITVSFAEPVLQINKNHDALTEDYIQDEVVLFRKGSATKTGDEYQVSYSVTSIAENGRKFVIVPDEELEAGTTYYIVLQAETLYGKNSGEENEKVTSSFKTASLMAPMFYPVDGTSSVSPATEIRITFSDVLRVYSSKKEERVLLSENESYLDDLVDDKKITLKRGSTSQSITATLDDDGRTIIITPDNALLEEKTYTVSVSAKIFYDEAAKKYNSAGSASFNTNEALSPTFSPKNDADE